MNKHKLVIYWSALALLLIGNVYAINEGTGNTNATNAEADESEPATWLRAVEERHAEKVRKFIQDGIDINRKEEFELYFVNPFTGTSKRFATDVKDKVPALTMALFRDDDSIAKLLISKGANLCVQSEYLKFTPLMYLLLKFHLLSNMYIEYRANHRNSYDKAFAQKIYDSEKKKVLKIISRLLDQGAYNDLTNNFKETAFLLAARYAQPKVMKLLLKLLSKKQKVQRPVVDLLLDSKHKKPRSDDYLKEQLKKMRPPAIDQKDVDGRTALMLTILSPNETVWRLKKNHPFNVKKLINGEKIRTKIVKMLLEHGADSDIKDIYGKTALDYAYMRNYTEIIRMLKAVRDKREEDKIFYTMSDDELEAFKRAAFENNVLVMNRYLKKTITVDGRSVLATLSPKNLNQAVISAACSNNGLDAIKWLVEKGAYIQESEEGYPLLPRLFEKGNIEAIEFLLKNGLNPNQKDRWFVNEEGDTILIRLTHTHYSDKVPALVRLLVKYGADINGTNNLGQTPLMTAIQTGEPNMVKVLLECGADVSIRDGKGATALDYARAKVTDYTDTFGNDTFYLHPEQIPDTLVTAVLEEHEPVTPQPHARLILRMLTDAEQNHERE